MRTADAVVVGAGLAGLAAAVAVAKSGVDTLHVAPQGPPDRRTSALMGPSVDYLTGAGLIDEPQSIGHPLKRIRLIDATNRLLRAPETLFDATEFDLPAFGWNFPNVRLAEAFHAAATALQNLESVDTTLQSLERQDGRWQLTLADGTTISARLVVAADGKKSGIRSAAGFKTREHSFTQSALVADLELTRPLGETSVEFHYPQGPFTLVPAGERRANLVWIDDEATLRPVKDGGDTALAAAATEKSQRLFGEIRPLTPAFIFPLSTLSVDRAGADGVVLVGESAHAFPPIGAQGLNLGLRDVADLAGSLAATSPEQAMWASQVTDSYAERRTADLQRTGSMVDALFRSLLSEMLPAQAARSAGLWALKLIPPLRRGAISVGMGKRS